MRPIHAIVLLISLPMFCTAAEPPASHGDNNSRERLDRAVVARYIGEGKVYVNWRMLESDPAGVAFNLYRRTNDDEAVKLNDEPIRRTTDFLDTAAGSVAPHTWFIRPTHDGRECPAEQEARVVLDEKSPSYISIPLQGDDTFQKVGIADLDGDRRYDFVVKRPNFNTDPYYRPGYWKRSPGTYKLEAYGSDGKMLWRKDLGWSIEQGIWYSPYVVYDLNGDGKAEVAVKTGEGDPRDETGRVLTGPEYLTILDGATGKTITQIDWPSRDGFSEGRSELEAYNYYCRNQLAVAYLDGKTPSLIVQRGTYNIMKTAAYRLRDGKLELLWTQDNTKLPKSYWGQGAHWMHAADVDGDGREEVLLGSSVLDDDGSPLWSTGLGHPDHFYIGDIDPARPGLEIYYGIEPGRSKNTMCLVDAKTGQILWGHDEKTQHIHSSGMCSDIDPTQPGSECYSGERDFKDKRWLRDAKGNVLSTDDLGGLSPRPVYWDADLQRELIRGGRIVKYQGPELPPRIEGHIAAVADVLGDWREEIITSMPGELRIYTTWIPAKDRRPCLMQDPIYRADVIVAAMGYFQVPMTSYDLATGKP